MFFSNVKRTTALFKNPKKKEIMKFPTQIGDYDTQEKMMAEGSGDDKCGRCNCLRKHHKNKRTYSYAKTQAYSGKSREIPILAITSCDCPYCICSCTGFIRPNSGMQEYFKTIGGKCNNGLTDINTTENTREAPSYFSPTRQTNNRPIRRKRIPKNRPGSSGVRELDFGG